LWPWPQFATFAWQSRNAASLSKKQRSQQTIETETGDTEMTLWSQNLCYIIELSVKLGN
jgi:hypothetical protein